MNEEEQIPIPNSDQNANSNSQFGLKWKMFFFACISKSVSRSQLAPNFIYLLLDIIITVYTGYYPLAAVTMPISDPDPTAIFPCSSIISLLTPQLLPRVYAFAFLCAFMILFLIVFAICFFNPNLILHLRVFFYPQIHLIFYPFISGTFGYCIYFVNLKNQGSVVSFIFAIANIILFFAYTYILSLLCFIETNSFIRPNPLFSEWFSGASTYYPTLLAFISLICYHLDKFSTIVQLIFLTVLTLVMITIGIALCVQQPFMMPILNELMGTKFLVVAVTSFMTIIAIEIPDKFSSWLITLVMIAAIFIFLLIHIFVSAFRKNAEKMLAQIGDPESLTVESLNTTFESIDQERKFRSIIKMGLLSGNNVVIDITFVRFCLERYPTSEWLLRYVVFLYATVWGCDSDTYQFLLHLCSVDLFSKTTEIFLFETTFCYMQASQRNSPMISRGLDDYRTTFLYACRAHRNFWLSGLESSSFEDARTGLLALLYQMHMHLHRLYSYYHFCPSIHFERAIFESDFKHKYNSSAKYFQNGVNYSKDPQKYISQKLFKPFSVFFPTVKQDSSNSNNISIENSSDGYAFISVRDQNDRARFFSTQLITYDSYIKKFCKPFFVSKTQLQTEFPFFNSKIRFLRITLIFVIICYVICLGCHYSCNNIFIDGKMVYNSILGQINDTLNFRRDISTFEFNIMLVVDIQNRTYADSTSIEGEKIISEETWKNFTEFAKAYLNSTERRLMEFRYVYDGFNDTFPGDSARLSNFTFLFGRVHSLFDVFRQTNTFLPKFVNAVSDILDEDIPNLIQITDSVYYAMIDYLEKYVQNIFAKNKALLFANIIIEILIPFISFMIIRSSVRFIFSKVFSIIKTIQPPVLKYIANMFDKLLSAEEHQEKDKNSYSLSDPANGLFPAFILLMLYPLIVMCFIILQDKTIAYNDALSDVMPFTPPARFVFYSQAWLEFQINDKDSEFSKKINSTIIDIIFGNDTLSINNMYNTFNGDFYVKCKFFDFPDYLFNLISVVIVLVSVPFLVYFFYLLFITEKVSRSGRYILYFLPSLAVNSNPVFQALIKGYHLSLEDVNVFANELKLVPKFKGAFCTFFHSEVDDIIETVGDRRMFIPFKPTNLNQICEYFESEGIHPSNDIKEFFIQKGAMLRMTIKNDQDISLSFIKPDQLFIKSEISNEDIIKKEKLVRYLSETVENFYPKKRAPIAKGIIFGITNIVDSQKHFDLIKIIQGQNDLFLFDTRNESLFGAIDIKAPKSAQMVLNFLKNLAPKNDDDNDDEQYCPDCRAAVAIGGPMTFFDMPRGQFSKSRCVADCYDNVFLLNSIIEANEIAMTKEFIIECSGNVQNDMLFEQLEMKKMTIANDEVIEYVLMKPSKIVDLIDEQLPVNQGNAPVPANDAVAPKVLDAPNPPNPEIIVPTNISHLPRVPLLPNLENVPK